MKPGIVIPTLNEAEHIVSVVKALSEPVDDAGPPRIWVADGGSADGTAHLVQELGFAHVSIIHNPLRIQAAAVNLAAEQAKKEGDIEVLVRADAHASYPPGFCKKLLEVMAETQAESVVVPLIARGGSRLQDAEAVLQQTWLGTGGSPHRIRGRRGFVDHGHHAAMRLDSFLELGGYDTDFHSAEDVDFDYRLKSRGGRIFMEPSLAVDYYPRASFAGLFRQQRRNGRHRVRHHLKNLARPALRQLLPFSLLPFLLLSSLLGFAVSEFFWTLPVGYVLLVLLLSFLAACRVSRMDLTGLTAALAITMHLGYSWGAWTELFASLPGQLKRMRRKR